MKYLDALIIGAGFSGLYQLHCLRDKLKLNTLVLEEGDDLGGTWYWNRYPGARCDSESFTYGFTFSKKIFKKWTWKERYPKQKVILKYLKYFSKEYNLKKIDKGKPHSSTSRLIQGSIFYNIPRYSIGEKFPIFQHLVNK